MLTRCHTGKSGQGFALGAGNQQHQFGILMPVNGVQFNERASGNFEMPLLKGQVDVPGQGFPGYRHLAPLGVGQVENLLYPLDMAGKERNKNTPFGRGKNLAQADLDLPLGQGESLGPHVGGIRKHELHARLREFLERAQISGMTAQRVAIDLEIAGVYHPARRGLDTQAESLDNGMADREKIEPKIAEQHTVIRPHGPQVGPPVQVVLLELVFHQPKGKFRTVNRHVQVLQKPRQCANMILMAVGQDDAVKAFLVPKDEIKTGNYHVNPEMIIFGKHEPAVHHDHGLFGLVEHAVHADLTETAEGIDIE